MSNERVDLDFALHVPIDDFRHISASSRTAEGGSFPDPTGHELEGARADLLPSTRDSDDDARPPTLVTALEGLPHDVHISDALEAEVGAAFGQVDEVGNEITRHLRRIDEMSHPESLCDFSPRRI